MMCTLLVFLFLVILPTSHEHYTQYPSLTNINLKPFTSPINLQLPLDKHQQDQLVNMQQIQKKSRYDSELHVVNSKYSPELSSYRQGLFSINIIYGIIGMMIILSQGVFVLIKHVLKRKRNKRLNRFRKKYNKKEKSVLYGLFAILTIGCLGLTSFQLVTWINMIISYVNQNTMIQTDMATMSQLTHNVNNRMKSMCADNRYQLDNSTKFCEYSGISDEITNDMQQFQKDGTRFFESANYFVGIVSYALISDIIFLVVIVLTIKAIRTTNQKFFHVIGYVFIFISAFNFILIWISAHQFYQFTDQCVYSYEQITHADKYIINKGAFYFIHKMKETTSFQFRKDQQYNYELMLNQMDLYINTLKDLEKQKAQMASSYLQLLKDPYSFLESEEQIDINIYEKNYSEDFRKLQYVQLNMAYLIPNAKNYQSIMDLEPIQQLFIDNFVQNCLETLEKQQTKLDRILLLFYYFISLDDQYYRLVYLRLCMFLCQ